MRLRGPDTPPDDFRVGPGQKDEYVGIAHVQLRVPGTSADILHQVRSYPDCAERGALRINAPLPLSSRTDHPPDAFDFVEGPLVRVLDRDQLREV